jgi:hypothetical protein
LSPQARSVQAHLLGAGTSDVFDIEIVKSVLGDRRY